MKRKIFYGIVALATLLLGSCVNGPTEEGEAAGLSIKVYSPVKVLAGQLVTINGTRLDEVTEVVFPGNVSVTDITHLGGGQISVVTPSGVTAGELTVVSADATAVAPVHMTVGSPSFSTISYPEVSMGPGAWITTELLITGTDLEFTKQAIFPAAEGGNVVVRAIDFVRKANNMLKIKVPYGIAAGEAKIALVACNDAQFETDAVLLVDEVPAPPSGGIEWITAWEGDETVDGGAQPKFPAELFGKLKAGETLRIHIANNGVGWGQVYYGDWSKMIMEIPGGYAETSMEMVVTQDDVDKIKAVGILAQGAGWNVVKIEYSAPIPIWITTWEGDETVDGGKQPSFPADLFGKLKAGQTLRLHIANNGVGWGQVYYGDWSKMIMEIPGGYAETSMEMVVTQEDVDKIKAVGILAQGAGWNVIKIEYSADPPKEYVAWEGEESVDGGAQPKFPAEGFASIAEGATLRMEFINNGVGWGQVYYGDWSKMIMEMPGGYPETFVEMTVTQEDVDKIKAQGILAQGAGFAVTRVVYVQ